MRLSINISTRGRPGPLKTSLEQTMLNVSRKDTRILIAVDDDDAETIGSLRVLPKDDRIVVSVKPREDNRGAKSDRVLTEAPADVYMVGHDCTPIITPGFDQIIVDAACLFPDGIGVVCSHMANASFPAMQAVTSKWVDLVGHIYNHDYPFWFIDHELDDLARMTGRYVFVDVVTHANETRPSKTIRMRDLHFWADYYDLSRFRRRATAFKIIDALDCQVWQKEMMKTWYAPVEARSVWINDTVRRKAFDIEQFRGERGEPDPGYLRTFEHARQQLKAMNREITELYKKAA